MKLQGLYKILLIWLLSIPYGINAFSQTFYFYTPNVIPSQTISTTYNGTTISGEYLTILGYGNSQITKPFIIVEGFDPLNNQGFQDYINLYNNNFTINPSAALLKNLYSNGYDVIILNFDNANDYIQNNAMLLVKLINDINAIKVQQTDNMVVMGFSMGGLVTRYALTWMEANNQDHHTRLFISHDTPNKGANFPIGLQEFVEDFRNNTAVAWIAADILLRVFDNSFPAAKQMLVYHYKNSKNGVAKPADEKVAFFNELYNLNPSNNGYPSKPVKIAISNGNYSGNKQSNLNAGDIILNFDYWKRNDVELCSCSLWYLIWHWNCDQHCSHFASDHITATIRAGFTDTDPLEKFYIYTTGLTSIGNSGLSIPMGGEGAEYFSSSNYDYDSAPGSTTSNYMNILSQSIHDGLGVPVTSNPNACFIPTISALDLNIDLNNSFDLNSAKCTSMFDYIYANSTENTDHWYLSDGAETFAINHILANESPIQHKNIIIPENTVVQNNQSYPVIASGSISNAGNFTLESGSNTSLTSGNLVTINAGFSMEDGATLSVSTSTDICMEDIAYIPNYLASLEPVMSSPLPKYYDCSNYQQMPDYNSDSLYFNCDLPQNVTLATLDSALDSEITIYPNPTSGNLTISFTNDVPINSISVQIKDVNNNTVYYLNPINNYSLNIDVSNCPIGLITIQFDINNGAYQYTRKVIKE